MVLILLSLLVLTAGAIYLWLLKHYAYWADRNVPHEKPIFFLGNMQGIGRSLHWKDINRRIYKRFKGTAPFVGHYTFMTKAVMLLELDLIKHIMIKDFGNFSNRGLFHNVRDDPLTGNLLFLDGEQWRELRHKLSPVFTTGKIKFMFPTMVEIGKRLAVACSRLVETGGEVEAKDLCALYTTDVIGTCAFGIECNSLQNPSAEFRQMGRAIFEEPRQSTIVQAFMFTDPDLARTLRMKLFADDVSAFFMNAVRETVATRETNQVKRNDFMDMLIELKQKRDRLGANSGIDDMSNGLTIEQVAAQAMAFFTAGFETSSTLMSFCMYSLAVNAKVQETLREEVQRVMSKYANEITYESIKEMIYLEKVIKETLRMYSVLPHVMRKTVEDYHVPNTNFIFERGTRIIIPIDAIHMDPELYPDPEKFDPERFTAEECARRHVSAYLPFGDGPRNCIGKRFGLMQVQVGIISLLQHFRISSTEKTEIPIQFSKKNFLIATESGIYLKLERITR